MKRELDLINPFQGRKWLRLFETNDISELDLKRI